MSSFGQSLRQWRRHRNVSQLDLGLTAEVSAKHISFLETGKAMPSPDIVIQLSEALDIPLAERNTLLKQSGYAEAYSRRALNEPVMASVNQALELLLDNQNPFPAMVLDGDWNIILANEAQKKITSFICNNPGYPDTNNLMELIFHPQGFKPLILNWEEVAFHLLLRLRKGNNQQQNRHKKLIQRVTSYSGIPKNWHKEDHTQSASPTLTVNLMLGDIELSFLTVLSTFGTPVDVTVQELTIEQYFPVDDVTRNFMQNNH